VLNGCVSSFGRIVHTHTHTHTNYYLYTHTLSHTTPAAVSGGKLRREERSVDNYNYDNNRNARSFLANFRRSRASLPPVLDVKFFLIKSVRLESGRGILRHGWTGRRGGGKNNGINCFISSGRLCKSIGSGGDVEHWQQSYLYTHTLTHSNCSHTV